MSNPGSVASRLVCLFLAGLLLFSFPLLALFNVSGAFLGVPILYAYLFSAWVVLILMLAVIMERGD